MEIPLNTLGKQHGQSFLPTVSKSEDILMKTDQPVPKLAPNGGITTSSCPTLAATIVPELTKKKGFPLTRKSSQTSNEGKKGFSLTKKKNSEILNGTGNGDKNGVKSQLAYKKNLFMPISGSFDDEDSDDACEQRFITKRGFLHI